MIGSTMLAYIGFPGGPELIIVAVIILLLFGKRLPGVMRSLGTSIVEFKKGVSDVGNEDSGNDSGDESNRIDS